MAENKVVSFFCSAFPSPKPVRKWVSTALRRVESAPSAQFSVLLAGPHPEGRKEAGAFTAKEALKPLPIDRLLTRMQESKLQTPTFHNHIYTCTPSPREAEAHSCRSARTYLIFCAIAALHSTSARSSPASFTPELGRFTKPDPA